MSEELVPLKIIIRRGIDSNAKWPKWNLIAIEIRRGLKGGTYIGQHGIGLHLDKVDNLGTGHTHGTAVTCVPKDFADAAVEKFPDDVSIIMESELQTFWNTRSKIFQLPDIINAEELRTIKLLEDLGEDVAAWKAKALDRDNKLYRGRIKNPQKTWALFKEAKGITLHSSVRDLSP
jgi:hypothetical protein